MERLWAESFFKIHFGLGDLSFKIAFITWVGLEKVT